MGKIFPQANGESLDMTGSNIYFDGKDAAKGAVDPGKGLHLWVLSAAYRIGDPESKETRYLDMENLLDVTGPGCYKCQLIYSMELANKPCKGSM